MGTGLLDWADPCADALQKFNSSSEAAKTRADEELKEWDGRTEPPDDIRPLYVQAIHEGAYKAWFDDPATQVILKKLAKDDPNFDAKKLFRRRDLSEGRRTGKRAATCPDATQGGL